MIANTQDCDLIESFLNCGKLVLEWLCVNHVHQIYQSCTHKEDNLDSNIVVPVVGTNDEEELSNDVKVIIHHRFFAFLSQTCV